MRVPAVQKEFASHLRARIILQDHRIRTETDAIQVEEEVIYVDILCLFVFQTGTSPYTYPAPRC